MTDITTVPELRRLLDAKRKVAVNNGECRGCIDLGTVADYACDACSEAAMAFDNALTDDTLTAFATALEAAEEMAWILHGADITDVQLFRATCLEDALAPLFPKEDDCE